MFASLNSRNNIYFVYMNFLRDLHMIRRKEKCFSWYVPRATCVWRKLRMGANFMNELTCLPAMNIHHIDPNLISTQITIFTFSLICGFYAINFGEYVDPKIISFCPRLNHFVLKVIKSFKWKIVSGWWLATLFMTSGQISSPRVNMHK